MLDFDAPVFRGEQQDTVWSCVTYVCSELDVGGFIVSQDKLY